MYAADVAGWVRIMTSKCSTQKDRGLVSKFLDDTLFDHPSGRAQTEGWRKSTHTSLWKMSERKNIAPGLLISYYI